MCEFICIHTYTYIFTHLWILVIYITSIRHALQHMYSHSRINFRIIQFQRFHDTNTQGFFDMDIQGFLNMCIFHVITNLYRATYIKRALNIRVKCVYVGFSLNMCMFHVITNLYRAAYIKRVSLEQGLCTHIYTKQYKDKKHMYHKSSLSHP